MSLTQESGVIFDEPGPRGKRLILFSSIAVTVAVMLLLGAGLYQFWVNGQLESWKWLAYLDPAIINFLGQGVLGTLGATVVAAVFSFPLGLLLALGRLSKIGVVAKLATAWIEVFRALPLLLLVYAFLLALPRFGVTLPVFWMLLVPMVVSSSATTAEVFRAGILAVPHTQIEAAKSIGLTERQTMRLVVLPQAFVLVLPNLLTSLVSLLKDSTLGYVVSFPELMQQAKVLTVSTNLLVQTYFVVAVIYIVMNFALTKLADWLQRRQRTRARTSDSEVDLAAPVGALA